MRKPCTPAWTETACRGSLSPGKILKTSQNSAITSNNACALIRYLLILISLILAQGTTAQTPVANRVKAVAKRLPGEADIVAKYTDNRRHCLYYTLRNRLFRYDVKTNRREEVSFSPAPYSTIIATWLSPDGNAFFVAVDRKELSAYYLDDGQELWMYNSWTKDAKKIGQGFCIAHRNGRITVKRAARTGNSPSRQKRSAKMVRDHQYDEYGVPLGMGDVYELK